MSNNFVSQCIIAKVLPDHWGLDLNGDELAPVIHRDRHSNHLWEDDHVTEVSLDNLRLPSPLGGTAETKLIDEAKVLHTKPMLPNTTTATSGELRQDVGDLHRHQLLDLDAMELWEGEPPTVNYSCSSHILLLVLK